MLVASSMVFLNALVLAVAGASHFIGLLVHPAHSYFWFSHRIRPFSHFEEMSYVLVRRPKAAGVVPMQ